MDQPQTPQTGIVSFLHPECLYHHPFAISRYEQGQHPVANYVDSGVHTIDWAHFNLDKWLSAYHRVYETDGATVAGVCGTAPIEPGERSLLWITDGRYGPEELGYVAPLAVGGLGRYAKIVVVDHAALRFSSIDDLCVPAEASGGRPSFRQQVLQTDAEQVEQLAWQELAGGCVDVVAVGSGADVAVELIRYERGRRILPIGRVALLGLAGQRIPTTDQLQTAARSSGLREFERRAARLGRTSKRAAEAAHWTDEGISSVTWRTLSPLLGRLMAQATLTAPFDASAAGDAITQSLSRYDRVSLGVGYVEGTQSEAAGGWLRARLENAGLTRKLSVGSIQGALSSGGDAALCNPQVSAALALRVLPGILA